MTAARKALLVATYDYRDPGLRRLVAPGHDAEALAEVLRDPAIAGFDVTVLVNEPAHVVGETISDFYRDCRREDLTLLYFSGHGLKDDEGRLYLAMTNTRRDALLFTGLSAAQIDEAMSSSVSRRKVLILDCCYSGAFPAGRVAKADESVHALERFQGKGRAVLTASDSTQYSFDGDDVAGSAAQSVFTRFLAEAIRSGEADLDGDGDISLDELYSYVHDRVVAEMPQQRPKKQEDVDGRIVLARNVHWSLPAHLRNAIDSPLPAQRLVALDGLAHLHRVGNDVVRAAVVQELAALGGDDSRAVSSAATALLVRLDAEGTPATPPPVVPAPRQAEPEPVRPQSDPPPSVTEARPVTGPAPARPPRPSTPRVWPVLAAVLLGLAFLTASRFAVFEADNGYHESDLGWPAAAWLAEAPLPLLLAAGLLLRGRTRWRTAVVATGIVAGVVLAMVGEVLQWAALFVDSGYHPGPAAWSLVTGTLVLALGLVVGLAGGRLRRRPRLRRDVAGVGAGLGIVVAAVLWVFAIGPVDLPPGQWLFFKSAGLLFTLACGPLAVLTLLERQRLLGLAAVTTTAAAEEIAAVALLLALPENYAVPPLLTAMLAVLLAVGAAYAGQLVPGLAGAQRRAADVVRAPSN